MVRVSQFPNYTMKQTPHPSHAATLAELRQKTAAQSIAINQRRESFMKANPVQPRTFGANKKAKK
jgi:hypothetical protein